MYTIPEKRNIRKIIIIGWGTVRNLEISARIEEHHWKSIKKFKKKVSFPIEIRTAVRTDAIRIFQNTIAGKGGIDTIELYTARNVMEGAKVTQKETISIEGVEKKAETEAVISMDTTTQQIAQGEEKAYMIMFANLGEQKEIYSVEVTGTETWADSRAEPAFLAVDADSTGELVVYLQAKEDAVEGTHPFTVKIMSGTDVVKEVNLNAEVTAKAVAASGLRIGLQIGFAVLVVLLVILIIVVAFRRIGGGGFEEEEKPLEPETTAEGQTYY